MRTLFLTLCLLIFTFTCQARPDNLVFLSADALVKTRQALQKHQADALTEQAWRQLQRQADKALSQPDPSVMDKGLIPPSGSRHDYLSLSAYWWPDARQKTGLPWIRRDGEVNPDTKNDQTDGVRLARFSADVQALALAWFFSGDARYASKAQSMIRHWFIDPARRMNPNLNYAQGIPGRTAGRHDGVLDGRYFATRMVDALILLRQSPGWRNSDEAALHRWFSDYLSWLQTSKLAQQERNAPNNHGSWYSVQVAGIAAYLDNRAVIADMTALAKSKIDGQIEREGTQPLELARTRSFHYSFFNLQALTAMAALASQRGEGDLWHYKNKQGGSLLTALDYMAPFSDPARHWPWKTRERNSERLIPLLLLADTTLKSDRYQSWINHVVWRDASAEVVRDVWLLRH
ncbi:alginate lyase family protein [Pantoea sp. SJZ147]|uniref:alginate lyase family protein n=1 Tax=Pantoea TaxID=53335 RepID=UPI0011A26E0E|nr:alginate lyase family protein [Pantoea sp. SJZ147]TWD44327.1 alginate lyase [Pantoea sp. SJZ147]